MIADRILGRFLLAAVLAPSWALSQETLEELDPNDVLAVVRFDVRTYELYQPWADKWFEELSKPVPPHERPYVEGKPLVNSGDSMPVAWVRTILSTEAVRSDDGSEYVLTVMMPARRTHDRAYYSFVLQQLTLNAFYNEHGFNQEAFQTRQEEIARKAEEFEAAAWEVQSEIDEFHRHLERDRRKLSDETLQAQIAAIEEGPKLELEMNLAEMNARREATLDSFDEVQEEAALESHLREKRQKVARELVRMMEELQHLKRFVEPDAAEKVEAATQRIAELEREADMLELEMTRVSPGALVEQLNGMLADAEINAAGLEARRDVLRDQYESLKERLEVRVTIQQQVDELTLRQKELNQKARETYESLDVEAFRTPKPVIEWVPEPDKAAQ